MYMYIHIIHTYVGLHDKCEASTLFFDNKFVKSFGSSVGVHLKCFKIIMYI